MSDAHTWKMTPKQKMPMALMRERRRPKKSPMGAEIREPSTVPALSMETINETWLGLMAGSPFLSV